MSGCSENEKIDENKDDYTDPIIDNVHNPENSSSEAEIVDLNENQATPKQNEIKKEATLSPEVLYKRQQALQNIRTTPAFRKVFLFYFVIFLLVCSSMSKASITTYNKDSSSKSKRLCITGKIRKKCS
jgi:hypothetical protein